MSFIECDTCRAKPGTPPLCIGCLANRGRIAELEQQLADAKEANESHINYQTCHECPCKVRFGRMRAELADARADIERLQNVVSAAGENRTRLKKQLADAKAEIQRLSTEKGAK